MMIWCVCYEQYNLIFTVLTLCSLLPEGDVWAEHCWRRAGDPGVCQQQQHAIWNVLSDFVAEDCAGAVRIKERKHHETQFRVVQRPIQKRTVDRSVCCCGFWRGCSRATCKQEGHHNNSWVCSGRSDAHRNGDNDRWLSEILFSNGKVINFGMRYLFTARGIINQLPSFYYLYTLQMAVQKILWNIWNNKNT